MGSLISRAADFRASQLTEFGAVQARPAASLDADAVLFFENQLVEDGQDLFAVTIHAAQGIAEIAFIAMRMQPLIKEWPRNVDIPAQGIGRVAAQKKAVENCRFPLRRERVNIVATGHTVILYFHRPQAVARMDLKSSLSQQSNNAVKSLEQNHSAVSQKSKKKYLA
jgi:hypothetical protein